MAGSGVQKTGNGRSKKPEGSSSGLLTSLLLHGLNGLQRLDGFANSVTGLGVAAYDKTVNAVFRSRAGCLGDAYLEALYDEDALARRICEIVPDEMVRPGFDISVGDVPDAIKVKSDIMHALRDLRALPQLKTGKVWENVFGGGALLLDVDEGGETDPSKPLEETRIRKIRGLIPVEKPRMVARTWWGPDSPDAGMPETWQVTPLVGDRASVPQEIHASRLIIFPGGRVTHQRRMQLQGWGYGLLQSVHDVLRDYDMSWRGVTHMLQSANQDVWTMSGLKNALASGDEAAKAYFAARFTMAQQRMGPNRAITLDSQDESFQRFGSTFTGVPDTLQQVAQRMSAVTGIPMTKLFGMSPAGMNATGESDAQNWYDTVAAKRSDELEPQLRQLITLLMLSSEGPTNGKVIDGWDLTWKPFRQMSPKEQAELRKIVMETDVGYITAQVVPPEVVTVSRFRPDGWSPEMNIDQDAYKALVDAEIERLKSGGDPAADPNADPNALAKPVVDPAAATDPSATKPADTALSAGQITALQGLLESVTDGSLPRETVRATIIAVYNMSPQEADQIMAPLDGFEPTKAAVPPALAPFAGKQQPPPPDPKLDGISTQPIEVNVTVAGNKPTRQRITRQADGSIVSEPIEDEP